MRVDQIVDHHFTFQAAYEPRTGTLIRVPFYHLPIVVCYDSARGAMPMDILQNIVVFRTQAFGPGPEVLHWDERMKISGEHLDFYVRNLLETQKTFLFDPGLSILRNRVQSHAYRKKCERRGGIELYYKKWGIRFELDSELGIFDPSLGESGTWRELKVLPVSKMQL